MLYLAFLVLLIDSNSVKIVDEIVQPAFVPPTIESDIVFELNRFHFEQDYYFFDQELEQHSQCEQVPTVGQKRVIPYRQKNACCQEVGSWLTRLF